ncbi:hypothetical protein QR680_008179 [Steinernema hermaphroditum]|uniref:Apple domain-containing protein n=1 Tax=Steinernema hermaphroditum TaxID=289476 RepID=A0AA39IH85_9BILA|nr:hypothetical protein QR680_008179 [Steinernema hermaphroditum]
MNNPLQDWDLDQSNETADLKFPNPASIFRLKDVVESNPILRRLSMFSDEKEFEDITIDSTTALPHPPHAPIIVYSDKDKADSAERKLTTISTSRRKAPVTHNRAELDNFTDDYKKLNATLFREAIPPSQELPMRTLPTPGQATETPQAAVDEFFADTTTTVEPFTATIPFSYEDLDANWIDENNSNQLQSSTQTLYSTEATTTTPIEVTRFPTFANKEPEVEETFSEPESTTPFDVDETIFSTTAVANYHANSSSDNRWTTPERQTLPTTTLRPIVYPAYTMTAEPPIPPESYTRPTYLEEPEVTHQPINKIGDYENENSIEEPPIPAGHLTEVQGYVYRFHDGKTYQLNEDYDGKPKTYEKVRAMSDYLIPEPTRDRLERMKTSTVNYRATSTSSPMGIFTFDNYKIVDDKKPVIIPYGKAPSIFSIPFPLKQAEMVAVELNQNEVHSGEKTKEPMVKRNNSPLKYFPAYMNSEEEDSSEEYYDNNNEVPTSSPVLKENWMPTPEPFPAFSDRCFQNRRKAILVNVTPFERRINISPTNCLLFCSEFKTCRSVVYSSEREICDIYNVKRGQAMAKLVDLVGYTYLEVKDGERMNDCIQGSPSQKAAQIYHPQETVAAINARKDILETNHVNTNRQEIEVLAADTSSLNGGGTYFCPDGQDTIMMRSTGYRLAFFRGETYKQNVSESDCRFSCLMNLKDNYEPFNCVSTLYDRSNSECTHMQSGAGMKGNSLIEYDRDTVYYEKLCVSNSLSDLCDGRVLERIPQHTLLGYIRDVKNATSANHCIEMCRAAALNDGSCRSIVYFYQERQSNCFLSLVSREVDKELFTGESDTAIDYISLENCLDLERTIKRRPPQEGDYDYTAQLQVDSDEGVLSIGK